ncbi:MAG: hypothetical protein KGO05_11245, partial [Chloroflexota bacterium]|nr:hypothetical protein [Chloroflexota bacterium]
MRASIHDSQRVMRRLGLRASSATPAPAEMTELTDSQGLGAARFDRYPSAQAMASSATAAYPIGYPAPGAPGSLGSATAYPARPYAPFALPAASPSVDPDVWLIALPNGAGGMRSLEGADRPGAIRVSRPYGHLRTVRPVTPISVLRGSAPAEEVEPVELSGPLGATVVTDGIGPKTPSAEERARLARSVARKAARARAKLATAQRERHNEGAGGAALPAERPAPQIISAVEVETDAGIFRVERPHSVLDHSDMAWAMANLESGEPDSVVALPRRQLALLLTLLPTAEDPENPEEDPHWGWAHRLRGPWERGPLHPKGKLGRLIAIDPDHSGQGLHRACFEMLGTEDVV